jgi:hypothetical protein
MPGCARATHVRRPLQNRPGPCRSDSSPRGRRGPVCPLSRALSAASCDGTPPPPTSGRGCAGPGTRRVTIAVAGGEVHCGVNPGRIGRNVCSTRLRVSTNSFQSMALRKRRLAMLWLTETWSAACCWLSCCTSARWTAPVRAAAARASCARDAAPGSVGPGAGRIPPRTNWTGAGRPWPCPPPR